MYKKWWIATGVEGKKVLTQGLGYFSTHSANSTTWLEIDCLFFFAHGEPFWLKVMEIETSVVAINLVKTWNLTADWTITRWDWHYN